MSADIDSVFEHRQRVRRPTWRKALPWLVGAAVLVAAIVAIVVWVGNTGESTSTPNSNKPADDRSAVPKTIKLDPDARRVAKRFIETAVARRNLREAYVLAGPQIRQGQTMKEWLTGNIAVVPYPVEAIDYAPMKIDYSYPREAQIEVALLPKANAKGVKGQLFIATLIKNKQGRWQVNAWVPRSAPPVPSAGG